MEHRGTRSFSAFLGSGGVVPWAHTPTRAVSCVHPSLMKVFCLLPEQPGTSGLRNSLLTQPFSQNASSKPPSSLLRGYLLLTLCERLEIPAL